MADVSTSSEPLNGTQTARLSWTIPDTLLSTLLPHAQDQGPDVYDDVRAQFALWATTHPETSFPDLTAAWNTFVTPPAGLTHPAVLLPGALCGDCSRRRYRTKDLSRPGYDQCPHCHGTGRKAPRAVYAIYATPATFAIATDEPAADTGT